MATLRAAGVDTHNNYEPGSNSRAVSNRARQAAHARASRKITNNHTPAAPRGGKRDGRSHRESSSGGSRAAPYRFQSDSWFYLWLDVVLDYFDDLRPGPQERYSVAVFVMGAVASLLCFLPFYSNGVVFQVAGSSALHSSLDSPQFSVALLLSIVIAVPMLMDVLMDAFYVFQRDSGRKLHWFVRLFLLGSLTVPSILLLSPTTFPSSEVTVPGYLCVQAFKRLASTASMFAFIAHEKTESKEFKEAQHDPSRTLGRKSAFTFATYACYELFWLYAYTLGAAANQGVSTTNPLRILGVFFLSLSLLQLLYIIFVWCCPYLDKGPPVVRYFNRLFARLCRPGSVAALKDTKDPSAHGDDRALFAPPRHSFAFATRIFRSPSRPVSSSHADTERERADQALDTYLNSKHAHMSSRDISMALFFTAMLFIPAGGLVIAIATGNFAVNSFRANESEICGYVYLQMVFTTLILILPGWLARYELNHAMTDLSEKEGFIAQVAVEVRNPLNDVLLQINSVSSELAALLPSPADANGAAEREIMTTIIDTINNIAHSTEVALSTFTDLITVNKLDKGFVQLDVQDTHPWRFFRDVAKPFEVEARHKRSGFGMTCLQYSTGWANGVFIKVDRHKISQVLRTLILCCFKATPAGGNVHITLSFVKKNGRELALAGQSPSPAQSAKSGDGKEPGKGDPRGGLGVFGGVMGWVWGGGGGSKKAKMAASGRSRHSRSSQEDHLQEAHEWLLLEIHDTGKSLHRREVDGSLLRLRACRAMVDLHGGSMHVFPRANDRGVTFQVKLPLYQAKVVSNKIPGGGLHSIMNLAARGSVHGQGAGLTGQGGQAGGGPPTGAGEDGDSDESSDHGCFGMRNDFAGPVVDEDRGDSQMDWFVPDFNVDLNAPQSGGGSAHRRHGSGPGSASGEPLSAFGSGNSSHRNSPSHKHSVAAAAAVSVRNSLSLSRNASHQQSGVALGLRHHLGILPLTTHRGATMSMRNSHGHGQSQTNLGRVVSGMLHPRPKSECLDAEQVVAGGAGGRTARGGSGSAKGGSAKVGSAKVGSGSGKGGSGKGGSGKGGSGNGGSSADASMLSNMNDLFSQLGAGISSAAQAASHQSRNISRSIVGSPVPSEHQGQGQGDKDHASGRRSQAISGRDGQGGSHRSVGKNQSNGSLGSGGVKRVESNRSMGSILGGQTQGLGHGSVHGHGQHAHPTQGTGPGLGLGSGPGPLALLRSAVLADATAALSAPSPAPSRRIARRDDDGGRGAQSPRRREGGSGNGDRSGTGGVGAGRSGSGHASGNNSCRSVGTSMRQAVQTVQRIASRHRLTDAAGLNGGDGGGRSSSRPGSPTRLVASQMTADTPLGPSSASAYEAVAAGTDPGRDQGGVSGAGREEPALLREDSDLSTAAASAQANNDAPSATATATAAVLAAATAAVAAATAALRGGVEGGRGETDLSAPGDTSSLAQPQSLPLPLPQPGAGTGTGAGGGAGTSDEVNSN